MSKEVRHATQERGPLNTCTIVTLASDRSVKKSLMSSRLLRFRKQYAPGNMREIGLLLNPLPIRCSVRQMAAIKWPYPMLSFVDSSTQKLVGRGAPPSVEAGEAKGAVMRGHDRVTAHA